MADAQEAWETRIQELEIKVAFLEKELDEYKQANHALFEKLQELEADLRKVQGELEHNEDNPFSLTGGKS